MGPGHADLPMDRDLSGQPIAGQGRMTIQWQNRMAPIDARTMRFEDSVVVETRQQQLHTDALDVTFREPFRFTDANGASRPAVQQAYCRGRTLLEAREADASGQTAVSRIDVNDLKINAVSGDIEADGPKGRVITVRRSSGQMLAVGPDAAAPQPLAMPGGAPLVCLDVQFQRKMTGNLQVRQMAFHEQVRVAYAPVSAWNARWDDDDPDKLGPHGFSLHCDKLIGTQLGAPGARAGGWGLDANGNARAEGQSFAATGTRMTYDQGKDLLVVEGDGVSNATLLYQEQPGQRPQTQHSRRIEFWPKTNRAYFDGIRSGEFISPPGPQKGPRSPMPAPR